MPDQNLSNHLKIVVDLFSQQYSQFDDNMKRLQDENNKAHDQLFSKIDNMTTEVHDISTAVKVIINNQDAHKKEVEALQATVSDLTERLEKLESERGQSKYFRSTSMRILTICGAILGVLLGIWKILEMFSLL